MTQELKSVEFRTMWEKWTTGDVAGFPPALADKLIAKGVAKTPSPKKIEAAEKVKLEPPTLVVVTKAFERWSPGRGGELEIAGFSLDVAKRIVDKGYGRYLSDAEKKKLDDAEDEKKKRIEEQQKAIAEATKNKMMG